MIESLLRMIPVFLKVGSERTDRSIEPLVFSSLPLKYNQ